MKTRHLSLIDKGAKIFGIGAGLYYLGWPIIGLLVGEGILFGHRYFDDVIRIFSAITIFITFVSFVLILKDKRIGYMILSLLILITHIITLGHWINLWPCPYCEL